jgi:hypothetical protein
MNWLRPEVNIVLDVLKAMLLAKPDSVFINSLYKQYIERGGLSKKQLEGLHAKALKVPAIPPGKLATLEAIIKKRPTWHKAGADTQPAKEEKPDNTAQLMQQVLEKYPTHKRLVFLKSKFDHDGHLTDIEKEEVLKFHKLLIK